jgi:hypothetical protein
MRGRTHRFIGLRVGAGLAVGYVDSEHYVDSGLLEQLLGRVERTTDRARRGGDRQHGNPFADELDGVEQHRLGNGRFDADRLTKLHKQLQVAATHLLVGNAGGGILNLGGTVNITSSTVSGNTATGSGNLHMNQSASCNSNCSVSINGLELGDSGGGILNHAGTLTISSSTVSGNTTSASESISISQSASCSPGPNCSVTANAVGLIGGGGGIYNDGTLNVTSSNVVSNGSNTDGGGVFNAFLFSNPGPVATVKSSNISNNTAAGGGGGVFNAAALTLKSNTITGNSAASGGGVLNVGTLTQSSNTFSGNTPDNCAGC